MGIEDMGRIYAAEERLRDEALRTAEALCKELWELNDPKVREIFKKHKVLYQRCSY